MPETLQEAARRLCATYLWASCEKCPLDPFSPCSSASALPEKFPYQCEVIAAWAKEHPLDKKEKP